MTVFGADCTRRLSESPVLYCGAPTTWFEHAKAGVTPLDVWVSPETVTRRVIAKTDEVVLAVLCDTHRTPACKPIPDGAERAAPSTYLLKR